MTYMHDGNWKSSTDVDIITYVIPTLIKTFAMLTTKNMPSNADLSLILCFCSSASGTSFPGPLQILM